MTGPQGSDGGDRRRGRSRPTPDDRARRQSPGDGAPAGGGERPPESGGDGSGRRGRRRGGDSPDQPPGERRTSGQRRNTPRGGTPRGQRPGEGKRPFGGGQEKARAREQARERGRERGRDRDRDREHGESALLAQPGHDLLYGRNGVLEALRGRRVVHRLLFAEGVRDEERLLAIRAEATRRGLPIEMVPRLMLDDALWGANHQGVAVEVETFPYSDFADLTTATGTVLVLDHLQDPQNFGTLLRSAEAAGVVGVVIPEDRSVAVTAAVVNASAGAVEHLPVAAVPNLARALETFKGSGWWVVGLHGGAGSVPLFGADIPTPTVLVVGAEGSGIGQRMRSVCDLLVSLPMVGKVASLNAATAGAIALYELVRRDAARNGGEGMDDSNGG